MEPPIGYLDVDAHAEIVLAVAPETKGPKSDKRDGWTRAEELRREPFAPASVQGTLHFAALHRRLALR